LRAMMQTRTCDNVTVNLSILANYKHGETCGLISSITQPPSMGHRTSMSLKDYYGWKEGEI
jgi:hypothetical protein